jgi:pSer/pThr/pTyr-binding forkhead associated (FHA) protein
MQQAYVITGGGEDGRRIPVGSSMVIGRGANCDLVIRDLAASRRHLEIRNLNGHFEARDLDSSNGTLVNGRPIRACELADGDDIRIGTTSLTFVIDREPRRAPAGKTVFLSTVVDQTGREKAPPSSRSKELLEAAYTLMNSLSSNFNPCDLVDSILETTMRAVRAQRGAVLFAGTDHTLQP